MRFIILFLALSVSTLAFSQEYKRFKVGLGTGYLTAGTFSKGGLLYVEPAYRIKDAFSVGVRLEAAVGNLRDVSNPSFITSYSINGQYYFLHGTLRPYVGIGIGRYSANSLATSKCDCSNDLKQNVIGYYPRIGFDYGHFEFDIEYNFIVGMKMTSSSDLPTPFSGSDYVTYINTNYLSTKIGLVLGGGRKK